MNAPQPDEWIDVVVGERNEPKQQIDEVIEVTK